MSNVGEPPEHGLAVYIRGRISVNEREIVDVTTVAAPGWRP